MKKAKIDRKLIGRLELADLPGFGLMNVIVKTDTGAYTSSIHISTCEEIEDDDGKVLVVVFLDAKHPQYTGQQIKFKAFRQKKVKSSTGQEQLRYFVKGTIRLGNDTISTEFSVTTRKNMRHPILLGRKLLNGRFIVDPSKKNILQNTQHEDRNTFKK